MSQQWLLPPSLLEFVPAEHPSHFVRELVRESLDLGEILGAYQEERGYPPYHPAMMTALLLYGHSQGVFSSRRLAKACHERVDFMAVTGMQKPDFRTTSDFRKRHLAALGEARVALRAGRPQDALMRLSEPGRRYGRGAFAIDREVLRIDSLCAAATAFLREHGAAPQAAHVKASCGAH